MYSLSRAANDAALAESCELFQSPNLCAFVDNQLTVSLQLDRCAFKVARDHRDSGNDDYYKRKSKLYHMLPLLDLLIYRFKWI